MAMAAQAEPVIYHQRMSIAPETAWLRDVRRELQGRVGAKVRELRALRGWSQPDLGNRIAKVLDELEPDRPPAVLLSHQSTISRIEGGRQTLSLEIIEVLARALEVDPLELVGPAFQRVPAERFDIAVQRAHEFNRELDRLFKQVRAAFSQELDSPLGHRAMDAFAELALNSPRELETVVLALEGLVRHRRKYPVAQVEVAPGEIASYEIVGGRGITIKKRGADVDEDDEEV